MTQQVFLSDDEKVGAPQERRRVREMAGGSTAECAAVCCCCPFAAMNLLVLATYKVPAGLCKKAIHKRKRQRVQKNDNKKKNDAPLLQPHNAGPTPVQHQPTLEEHLSKKEAEDDSDAAAEAEAIELEEEMWARFTRAGFWRSASAQSESQLQTETETGTGTGESCTLEEQNANAYGCTCRNCIGGNLEILKTN